MDPNKPSLVAVMCLVCVVWQKPRHLWQLVAPWAQFCAILGCAALGAADTVHAWSSSQPAAAAGVPPSHFARIAKGGKPGMGGLGGSHLWPQGTRSSKAGRAEISGDDAARAGRRWGIGERQPRSAEPSRACGGGSQQKGRGHANEAAKNQSSWS